jgi:Uma2 family endonuclease
VEIVSSSNSAREMQEKINLYLAKGAHEVWLCDQEGVITYFSHGGQLEKSKEI